jgi:hypothetical protein
MFIVWSAIPGDSLSHPRLELDFAIALKEVV